jgi:hypothetical protein
MPGNVSVVPVPSYFGDLLLEAFNGDSVSEDRLNETSERVMGPYFLGQDQGYPSPGPSSGPDARNTDFDEGQLIDYKHFDANDIETALWSRPLLHNF